MDINILRNFRLTSFFRPSPEQTQTYRLSIFSSFVYDLYNPKEPLSKTFQKIIQMYPDFYLDDYEILDTLDTSTIAFINRREQTLVFVFRGTIWTNPRDLYNDICLGITGKPTEKDTKKALDWIKKVRESYPEYKVELTGHSLGGSFAETIAQEIEFDVCETFNSGVQPLPKILGAIEANPQVIAHRNKDDLLASSKPRFDVDFRKFKTIWYKDGGHSLLRWTGVDFFFYSQIKENNMPVITLKQLQEYDFRYKLAVYGFFGKMYWKAQSGCLEELVASYYKKTLFNACIYDTVTDEITHQKDASFVMKRAQIACEGYFSKYGLITLAEDKNEKLVEWCRSQYETKPKDKPLFENLKKIHKSSMEYVYNNSYFQALQMRIKNYMKLQQPIFNISRAILQRIKK